MDVQKIGTRIKQARTLRNYTLDDIANEIGVAKSTIQRYENGLIGKPKLPVLQAIADSLKVNPTWLSGKDVPMELRSINFPSTPIDCPFNSALAKLQNNDYNLSKEEREAIEKELPTVMEKATNAFNGFYHKISNLYEKEKVRQLFESFRLLNGTGQDKAIEHVSMLTKIPEYQKPHTYEVDMFSNIIELEPVHDIRRTTYTYYQRLASAGTGEYIFDDVPTDTIEAQYMEHADFIIGVNGDSMEPTYYDGDRVYVEKRQIVEIGEIGIFMVNNECLIKEAGMDGLISHNKKYNLIPGSEHIICVGKVLGKVEEPLK